MLSKSTIFGFIALAVSIVMAPNAYAESSRVAFVNIPKVLEKAPQAIAAKSRLEKEFEPRNSKLVQQRKDLRKLEQRLAREGVTMSESQLRKLEREIRDRRREIRRSQEDYREDLNLRRNDELRKLQEKVRDTIVTLAKRENYDLVIGDGVIYAGQTVDITDKVLEMLKQEFEASSGSSP